MNAFDKNFVGEIPTPSAKDRGYARASRTISKRMQAKLDTSGPATSPTADQKTAAAAKTARIKKGSL